MHTAIQRMLVAVALLVMVFTPGAAGARTVATLALDPATGTLTCGTSTNINIVLDTGGGRIDGADVILLYDPAVIRVNQITESSLFPNYPGTSFDNTTGRVIISGLASFSQPFQGQGVLGTINVSPAPEATAGSSATIRFDFDQSNPGKTTDSNVVENTTVRELLGRVANGSYTITGERCKQPDSPVCPSLGALPRPKEGKVTVCHRTGSDKNPYNIIEISEQALAAHLQHGDTIYRLH